MALTRVNRKQSSVPSIDDQGTGGVTGVTISASGVVDLKVNSTVNSNTIYHTGNDGAGSNLDADLLDGQQGSHYRINVYNSSGTLLN
jgi:hypothetical protein